MNGDGDDGVPTQGDASRTSACRSHAQKSARKKVHCHGL